MNDDTITDLKQFIAVTISQQTQQLEQKVGALDAKIDSVDAKLAQRIDAVDAKLTQKIDDLQAFVADAIDTSNDAVGTQLQDHKHRLAALEAKPA
ncbi:MAG TPA: hypothetical protein VLE99_04280 [Candidatus Saccharimonadales bacterium]|nr:hypothetical protein [Candidatus Saccharimonadales bacterium]